VVELTTTGMANSDLEKYHKVGGTPGGRKAARVGSRVEGALEECRKVGPNAGFCLSMNLVVVAAGRTA
jgi:hypothetical protein